MRKMGRPEQHFGVLTKLAKVFNGMRLPPAATTRRYADLSRGISDTAIKRIISVPVSLSGEKLQTGMGIPVRWLVIGHGYVDDRESSSCIDDNRNTRSGRENKAFC